LVLPNNKLEGGADLEEMIPLLAFSNGFITDLEVAITK
jgi:hypothetical protein